MIKRNKLIKQRWNTTIISIFTVLLLVLTTWPITTAENTDEREQRADVLWEAMLEFDAQYLGKYDYVYFGEDPTALDGIDSFDAPQPPPSQPPYIDAYFDNGWESPYNKMLGEYKEYPDTYKTWNFTTKWDNDTGTTVTITWDPSVLATTEYDTITLWRYGQINMTWYAATDMLTESSFTWTHEYLPPYPPYPETWYLTDEFQIECIAEEPNNPPNAVDDSDSCDEDTSVWTDVTANDYDSDGTLDLSSLVVISGPSDGSTNVNTTTGMIQYIPDADYHGSDSYEYSIADDDGASDTAIVSITVNDVNDPPVAVDDSDSCDEDGSTWTDVTANDYDSDGSLDLSSLVVISGPSDGNTNVNTTTGMIQYIPDADYHGSDSYEYSIADDDGATDTATVTISVNDVNDAPVALDDSDSTDEDTSVWTDVTSNDYDSDGSLILSSVTVISGPSDGSTFVNTTTGMIRYTPDANYHGSDSYTYEVSDDDGATDTAIVSITVVDVNDPPVADFSFTPTDPTTADVITFVSSSSDVDGSIVNHTWLMGDGTTLYGEEVTYQYGDDGGYDVTLTVTDDDGDTGADTQTVNVGNQPPTADFDFEPVDPMTYQTVFFNSTSYDRGIVNHTWLMGDGTTLYGAQVLHQYSDDGDYDVTLTVTDDDSATDSITQTVSVSNQAPIASFNYEPSSPSTADIVYFNSSSTDVDGSIVNWTWAFGDGTLGYGEFVTHSYDDNGVYSVTLTVTDDDAAVDQVSLGVSVSNVAPVALDDSDSTDEDTSVWTDVTANDYDSDGTLDLSSLVVISGPSDGSTNVNTTTGMIQYIPDANYHGSDSYTYQIADDDGASDTATVSITVNDVNDAPIALDDSDSCDEDSSVWTDVTSNDYDSDGSLDLSTLQVTVGPSDGSTNVNTTSGEIQYIPNADFYGSDSYEYSIADDDGATDTATVTISVNDVNDPPTAVDDSDSTDEDTSVWTDVTSNDYDSDGSLILSSVTVISGPSDGSTFVNTTTGMIRYTPDANYHGSDSYTYEVSDDDGATDTAIVSITVVDVNDPPVADFTFEPSAPTNADVIYFNSTSTDVDGSIVNWTWTMGDGTMLYGEQVTHQYADDGNYDVTLMVTDDDSATDSDTQTVSVGNQPPVASFNYEPSNPTTYQTVFFNSTSSDRGIVNWTWTMGDGTTLYDAQVTHQYSDDGDYDVTLTVTDDDSATDSITQTVSVSNQAPIASFNYEPSSPSTADIVYFNSTSTDVDGSIVNWTWAFGDGTFGYGEQVTHSYDDNGVYSVTLTVTDDDAAVDQVSLGVSVSNVAPVALDDSDSTDEDTSVWTDVTGNDYDSDGSLDLSSLVVISGPSDGSTNVNTTTGMIQYIPDADYHGSDSYTYQIADDDSATDTATVSISVNDVNDPPVAGFTYEPANPTTTDIIYFNSTSNDIDGTIQNYTWLMGDGITLYGEQVTYQYSVDGNYDVTLTVTDDDGDTDDTTQTVNVGSQEATEDVNQSVFNRGFPIRHAEDGDWAGAQNFTPTVNTITKVEIYTRAFGTPEFDLTVELRQRDDPDQHPGNATLIDTVIIENTSAPTSWTWLEIDFADTTVDPSKDYFIVCPPAPSGVTTSFGYEWGYAFDNQYDGGSFWFTRDGGGLWRDLPSMYEFTFKTYGYD